jgi:hypothetical protein
MNIEQFPEDIKNDIEDQSLSIFERIKDDIIVIGGWAVRAHLGEGHNRYTLDVDGVTDKDTLEKIKGKLVALGFKAEYPEWGIQFLKRYEPSVDVPETVVKDIEKVQIRIEISEPRITESSTPHFFEFSLTEFVVREISYPNSDKKVKARVPSIEHMAAVKLGLPVDYKNNHDAAMLLQHCDLRAVIDSILGNDDWKDLVLRRMPKLKGRIVQNGRLENTLALAAGLDIKKHISKLNIIERELTKNLI